MNDPNNPNYYNAEGYPAPANAFPLTELVSDFVPFSRQVEVKPRESAVGYSLPKDLFVEETADLLKVRS